MFHDFYKFQHFNYASRIDLISIITATATVISAFFVGYQAYLFRLSNAVGLVNDFEKRFEGEELIRKRKRAANALFNFNKNVKNYHHDWIEDILDFFETISMLTKKGILNDKMVWNTFFYYIYGYYLNAEKFIEEQQKLYPTRYKDLVWLQKKMVTLEVKEGGTLNKDEWKNFLTEEQDL